MKSRISTRKERTRSMYKIVIVLPMWLLIGAPLAPCQEVIGAKIGM